MNTEQVELITALAQTGHTRDQIKRELISQGLSSEGFEQEYQRILLEQHLAEPHEERKVTSEFLHDEQKAAHEHSRGRISGFFKWLIRAIALVLIVLLFIGVAMRFAPQLVSAVMDGLANINGRQSEDFSVSDTVLRSKVETTAVSMRLYGNRMGSFDGACKDVVIIAPIVCVQNSRSYAVYAPLQDGQFYCIDSKGFSGNVDQVSTDSVSCN